LNRDFLFYKDVKKDKMGIKYLNRFLREECSSAIQMIPISQLTGKKIAVDISIYLYKYSAENLLIENIYLMLSIFRYYQIIPVFIFDGKPPIEKKELLQKRREDKKIAEHEYEQLKIKLTSSETMIDNSEKQDIQNQMDVLKKKFICLKKETIDEVKQVLATGKIHRIMLDNFSIANTKKAVALIKGKYEIESSGGITEKTIRNYALCGVDYISVGALTHSVKSLELSLKATK
jgi:hypothetical protein